jgi:hypothetical protein
MRPFEGVATLLDLCRRPRALLQVVVEIDGSFHFRGFTYLVEAKWESQSPTFSDLAKLKANLDGKAESTRGFVVAMAGNDENVLEHMFAVSRRSPNNLVLVDGQDMVAILEGRLALVDALIATIDAAEHEARLGIHSAGEASAR